MRGTILTDLKWGKVISIQECKVWDNRRVRNNVFTEKEDCQTVGLLML